MTAFLIWWHRVVLRHEQQTVMNGETEPGVRCLCPWPGRWSRSWLSGHRMFNPRWFPSDGGNGR